MDDDNMNRCDSETECLVSGIQDNALDGCDLSKKNGLAELHVSERNETSVTDNITKGGSSNLNDFVSSQDKVFRSSSVNALTKSLEQSDNTKLSSLSVSHEFNRSLGCIRPRYPRLRSKSESHPVKTSNDDGASRAIGISDTKSAIRSTSYGSLRSQSQNNDLENLFQEPSNPLDEEEDFSFCRSSTRHKLTLLSIAIANFSASAAFAILAPFFPQEALDKGVDQSVIGFIFGVYELVIFLSAPFLGGMITKIGAKFMFVSGLFVSGVCSVLFGTLDMVPSGTVYIVMCFVTRSLEALGSSALVVASFAIIAHEFPRNVATVFGALETFSGFGMMVGPPIGGALYQLGGFGLPFFTLGGTLTVCGLASIWLMPTQNHDDAALAGGSTLSLFLKPSAFVITMSIVVGALSLGFLDPTLADHLGKFELSPFWVGAMFFLAPAVYALTAPIWGWLGDNKGYIVTMIVGGNILSALAFLLLGPAPVFNLTMQLWLVIVSLIILGLFLGCALIPTFKALIDSASANGFPDCFQTYGIVSGLFNSAFSFGSFLGPTALGGVVVDSIGFPWAASIVALCFTIMGLVVVGQYFITKYLLQRQRSDSLRLNPDKSNNDDEKVAILYHPMPPPDIIGANSYYCPGNVTTPK